MQVTLDFEQWAVEDFISFTQHLVTGAYYKALLLVGKILIEGGEDFPYNVSDPDYLEDVSIADTGSILKAVSTEAQSLLRNVGETKVNVDLSKWRMKDHDDYLQLLSVGDVKAVIPLFRQVVPEGTIPEHDRLNFELFAAINANISAAIKERISQGE